MPPNAGVLVDPGNVKALTRALKMLIESEKRLRARGVAVWLVGMTPGVLDVVLRSPLGEQLGRERMLFNLETAIERFLARETAPRGTDS